MEPVADEVALAWHIAPLAHARSVLLSQDEGGGAMGADLFISYAWTSAKHREWAHLLATQLKAVGFDVLLDADLDYGDDLSGFMRRATESRHVLMIVDNNYVERANTMPDSGVGIENRWISEAYPSREPAWLTALFIDNPDLLLPAWMGGDRPKGFNFNHTPGSSQQFPGSEQIEELWRWVADLPANRDSATSIAALRQRAARLERHAIRSEPSQWRSPDLGGTVRFSFEEAPRKTYQWGLGDSQFTLTVSGRGADSVYVLKDYGKAVGVVHGEPTNDEDLARHLFPGRTVTARVGQTVVLMNEHGRLAVVKILAVQRASSEGEYTAPYVDFTWRVIESS